MSLGSEQRLTAPAFAAAARVYWLEILPQTRRERQMRALQVERRRARAGQ